MWLEAELNEHRNWTYWNRQYLQGITDLWCKLVSDPASSADLTLLSQKSCLLAFAISPLQKQDPASSCFKGSTVHAPHQLFSQGELFRVLFICRDAQWLNQACLDWSYQPHPFSQSLLHHLLNSKTFIGISDVRYQIATTVIKIHM